MSGICMDIQHEPDLRRWCGAPSKGVRRRTCEVVTPTLPAVPKVRPSKVTATCVHLHGCSLGEPPSEMTCEPAATDATTTWPSRTSTAMPAGSAAARCRCSDGSSDSIASRHWHERSCTAGAAVAGRARELLRPARCRTGRPACRGGILG